MLLSECLDPLSASGGCGGGVSSRELCKVVRKRLGATHAYPAVGAPLAACPLPEVFVSEHGRGARHRLHLMLRTFAVGWRQHLAPVLASTSAL